MDNNLFTQLQELHVAGWNERDAVKRDALLKQIYAHDIRMHDKDFTLDGLQAVSDFIGKLLTDDPEFNFSAQKNIDYTQNGARLYGRIGTGNKVFYSMDFFVMENDKVAQLYVFMDADKMAL